MSYKVIARQWRPQVFEEVVGQDHVVRTLRNAVESKRIAQAYLFAGPRGTGKTTLARIFSKALNCMEGSGPTTKPCGKCPACTAIADGTSMDVTEIDGASNNKVEDVQEQILNRINLTPVQGRYRVFYIDEVHMLSPAAFNALLKTLEEPPEFVKFIFATTEPEKVLGTVLSRCQRFDLRKISMTDICAQLRKICSADGIEADEDALLAIARGADGGMRDAESALDQIIAFKGTKIGEDDVLGVFGLVSRSLIEELAMAILHSDISLVLRRLDALDKAGKDLRRLTAELIDHFRSLLVCIELGGDASALDLTENQRASLKKQCEGVSASAVLAIVEELIRLDGTLRLSLSQRTLVETSLIRCARAAKLVDLESILRKLTALENGAVEVSTAPKSSKDAPLSQQKSVGTPAPVAATTLSEPPPRPQTTPSPVQPNPPASSPIVATEPLPVVREVGEAVIEEPPPRKIDVEEVLNRPEVVSAQKVFGTELKVVDIQ